MAIGKPSGNFGGDKKNYMGMKIFIGADHRGFELKGLILDWLRSQKFQVQDCGAYKLDPNDDYPQFAEEVADKVSEEDNSRGILICGSGVGVDIVANKIEGIRCGLGFEVDQVKKAREDDDINVLAISSGATNYDKAIELVKIFLQTGYNSTPNHERRIEEISSLD